MQRAACHDLVHMPLGHRAPASEHRLQRGDQALEPQSLGSGCRVEMFHSMARRAVAGGNSSKRRLQSAETALRCQKPRRAAMPCPGASGSRLTSGRMTPAQARVLDVSSVADRSMFETHARSSDPHEKVLEFH